MSEVIHDQMGKNGFFWFHGVVEDIDDPMKLGRVRVRCIEYHTQNKEELPTEHLPWATVLVPATSSSVSGKGISPTGLLQGSWVVGFFRDGNNFQDPIIIGSIHGIPAYPANIAQGFNDPEGKWPNKDHLNEPDTNRLVRGESLEKTIVEKKKKERIVGVKTALQPWLKWEEKETEYAAQYPKNHVMETESGHIVELDDTPEKERIGIYHKAGTWMEIHPDGTKVEKIVGEDNEIVLSDKKLLVKGNCYLNMDGAVTTLKTAKDFYIEIGGDVLVHTKGNVVMETDKNFEHRIHGTYTVASDGGMLFVAPRIDFNPEGVQPGLASSPNLSLGQASPMLKRSALSQDALSKLQDKNSDVFLNTDYLKGLNAQPFSLGLQKATDQSGNALKSWGDNQGSLTSVLNGENKTSTIPSNITQPAKITSIDSSSLYSESKLLQNNAIESLSSIGTDEQVIKASQTEKVQVDAAIAARTSQTTQLQQVVGESNVNLVTTNPSLVSTQTAITTETAIIPTQNSTSVVEPLGQNIGGVLNSSDSGLGSVGETLQQLGSNINLSSIAAIGAGIGLAGVGGPAGVAVGGAVGGILAVLNPVAAIQAVNTAANISVTTVPSPSSFLSSGPQDITNLSAIPLPPVGGGLSGSVTDTALIDIGGQAIPTQSLYAVSGGKATLISAYPGRDSTESAVRGIPAIPIVAFESEFPTLKEDITEIDGGEF